MTYLNSDIVIKLEDNQRDSYLTGVEILFRLLDNVIREPDNQKFRTIRLENKTIKDKLLVLNGVKNLLLEIGFEETDNELRLPPNILIAKLKKYREYLHDRFEVVKTHNQENSKSQTVGELLGGARPKITKPPTTSTKNYIAPTKSFTVRTTFPQVLVTANAFLKNLEHISDSVMQYEDSNLQAYGRSLIPVETFNLFTINRLREMQKMIVSGKCAEAEPYFKDMFLVELVNWFNTKFFTWVNTIPCRVCGNEDVQTRGSYQDNGTRVETYTCCNQTSQFYRYNDIECLLKTRRGRCGEYANCFTFLCRCLGYNARYVYATFDHVWTEVYSDCCKRWVHIDPSENVVDAPLMYQHGWKRVVDYVIAFSNEDVQDVTWRYVSDHGETLTRRKKCSEDDLLKAVFMLRNKRQLKISELRKAFLVRRTFFELASLMTPKVPTEDEQKGRSSGSIAWKLSRGEQRSNNFYIFNSMKEEIPFKQFNVRYSCSRDVYERFIQRSSEIIVIGTESSWQSCHYLSENIFRKHERDWKMVYLARAEDQTQNEASIMWKFDFNHLTVKTINLKFQTKTYENGKIDLSFQDAKGNKLKSLEDIISLSSFGIRAVLSGGKGDIAWQHTQLFRQSLSSKEFPFEINITFN